MPDEVSTKHDINKKIERFEGITMTLKINLQKSVAEMLVLSILNNGTMYGYQLIQELEAQSKGLFSIKEGTLYPLLYRLIDNNMVSFEKKLVGKRRTRVYYNITEDGKEYLQQILKSYQDMVQGVTNVLVKNGQSIHIVTE